MPTFFHHLYTVHTRAIHRFSTCYPHCGETHLYHIQGPFPPHIHHPSTPIPQHKHTPSAHQKPLRCSCTTGASVPAQELARHKRRIGAQTFHKSGNQTGRIERILDVDHFVGRMHVAIRNRDDGRSHPTTRRMNGIRIGSGT